MPFRRAQKARLLLDTLEQYEAPLTADFQRVYGLRLSAAVVERDPEEVLDLIEWLTIGSAYLAVREAKGDRARAHELYGWLTEHDLSLAIANLIAEQTYVLKQINSKKKIPKPDLVPSPRGKTEEVKKRGVGDATGMARALLNAQKGVS